MDNTFMTEVDKTSKEIQKVSVAIVTTISCVIVTTQLIKSLLAKRVN